MPNDEHDEPQNPLGWEVSVPDLDNPGMFHSTDPLSYDDALKVAKTYGADDAGRICIVNKYADDAITTPPKPSVIEAAIGAVLGRRNWGNISDRHEAHKVWGENMDELEQALRAEGYGALLDKGIVDLDIENHAHGQCHEECKDPSHNADALSKFWSTTEPFGWGTKTTDSEAIKVALLRQLTPLEADAIRSQFDKLTHALSQALRAKHIRLECGDDSYWDLMAHVVGLGRAEYEKALADPQLLKARCDSGKFTESFAYALPHASDFEYLTLEHYIGRAAELRTKYDEAFQDDDHEKIHAHCQIIIGTLALVQEGMITPAMEREKATRASAAEIEKYYQEGRQRFGGGMIDGGSIANPHGVYNLFIDLKRYYIPFHPPAA